MRLITEENIDQLTNMKFSNNVDLLMQEKVDNIEQIARDTGLKKMYIDDMKEPEVKKITPGEPEIEKTPEEKHKEMEDEMEEELEEYEKEHEKDLPWWVIAWEAQPYNVEDGEVFRSLILDENGRNTDIWFVDDYDGDVPDRAPIGWRFDDLYYYNNDLIHPGDMTRELEKIHEPNNWDKALRSIKYRHLSELLRNPDDPFYEKGMQKKKEIDSYIRNDGYGPRDKDYVPEEETTPKEVYHEELIENAKRAQERGEQLPTPPEDMEWKDHGFASPTSLQLTPKKDVNIQEGNISPSQVLSQTPSMTPSQTPPSSVESSSMPINLASPSGGDDKNETPLLTPDNEEKVVDSDKDAETKEEDPENSMVKMDELSESMKGSNNIIKIKKI